GGDIALAYYGLYPQRTHWFVFGCGDCFGIYNCESAAQPDYRNRAGRRADLTGGAGARACGKRRRRSRRSFCAKTVYPRGDITRWHHLAVDYLCPAAGEDDAARNGPGQHHPSNKFCVSAATANLLLRPVCAI